MDVELTGHFGGDMTHALSAWTSTERDLSAAKLMRRPDLLRFLASQGHHTPFEKSYIQFLVRVDTASHIHLLKHRIGVSINGESARYKSLNPTFHIPEDWPETWRENLDWHNARGNVFYERALEELTPILGRKRAKESARYFLPYSTELTLDVSFNFRSFMHFIGLRYKPDAQREIQDIAEAMIEAVRAIGDFDESLSAFLDPSYTISSPPKSRWRKIWDWLRA